MSFLTLNKAYSLRMSLISGQAAAADCCVKKCCDSALDPVPTPIQDLPDQNCEPKQQHVAVDTFSDTCCAGGSEGNSPVARGSGGDGPSCTTNSSTQDRGQIHDSMDKYRYGGEGAGSNNSILQDENDSCCHPLSNDCNDGAPKNGGPCCNGRNHHVGKE